MIWELHWLTISGMRLGWLGFLLGCVPVLVGGSASGEPQAHAGGASPDEFRLGYDAPPECPDREAFIQQVNLRAGNSWQPSDGNPPGVIQVTIGAEGAEFAAHMVMVNAVGECAAARTHRRAECAEVAAMMALSVSEAIREQPCGAPKDAPVTSAPPLAAVPPGPPSRSPHRSGDAVKARAGESGLSVGELWFIKDGRGLAREYVWEFGYFLGYRSPKAPWSARLAVAYSDRVTVSRGGLSLRLRLETVRGYLCPVELFLAEGAGASFCAAARVGVLDQEGKEGETAASGARFWAGAGVAGRLRIAGKRAFFEWEPTFEFPIMRYRLKPRQDVEDSADTDAPVGPELISWIALATQANIGLRF